jgi:Zn-dependent M28 family amino/carboxypeptidase
MGDPVPEKGYFFRSDHFEFAKVGVPAFYAEGTYEHREKGVAYAKGKSEEYTSVNYHQPSDEYSEDWDLSGAIEDAQLYLNMGLRIANEDIYPQWKEGSEFKRKRKLID